MLKSNVKLICTLFVAGIITSLVGCSTETESDKTSNEPGDSIAEPFTFSYMGTIWGDHPQDGNVIFDELFKRTNTDIEFQWFPTANFEERVGTILASGDLPDIIYGGNISSLIAEGAIIPLDDLLEEHGQNILAAIGEEDLKYMRHSEDGKIYFIPTILDFPPAYAMQIRQDWLEEAGIDQVPETWDEWKEAWSAFLTLDANIIPYAGDVYSLMPAFGLNVADRYGFVLDQEGRYTLAYELPEFRLFLEEMRDLYEVGILDKEFSTRGTFSDNPALETAFHSNIAGSGMTWAANTRGTTEVLREIDSDAMLIGVPPIQGPEGHQGILQRRRISGSAAITIDGADKAAEIIQFFDYVFSQEGIDLMSFGIEGEHHEIVDGKPQLIEPYSTSFTTARETGLNFTPIPHAFDGDAFMQITLAGKEVEELDELTTIFYDALLVGEDNFFMPLPLLQTDAFAEKQAMVFPVIEQLMAEAIIGRIDIDTFFEEYEKLRSEGLQDILDQGQEAWERLQ